MSDYEIKVTNLVCYATATIVFAIWLVGYFLLG